MRTYQDLEAVQNDPAAKTAFVQSFIAEHVTSAPVRTAEKADKYDKQLNTGVDDFLDALADIDYKLNGISKRAIQYSVHGLVWLQAPEPDTSA